MAKYLVQLIVLGTQVVGKAFSRALRQEIEASQRLAKQRASQNNSSQAATNSKLGMSLAEACEILNIEANQLNNKELLEKNYKHLFSVNDKAKGGSFYIQSKMRPLLFGNGVRSGRFVVDLRPVRYITCSSIHRNNNSNEGDIYEEAIREENIQKALKRLQRMKLGTRHQQETDMNSRRPASIFIPICRDFDDESPAVLLTRRSFHLTHNKGDLCFPGGFEEGHDKDVVDVAVREMIEEIGAHPQDIKVYGQGSPIFFRDNIHLHPVFGFVDLHSGNLLKLNEKEVDSVHTYRFRELCDDRNWFYTQWTHGWTLPVFRDREGRHPKVWGMTAIILYLTMANLLPKAFPFDSSYISRKRIKKE